jgi:hypothetical protein
MKQFRQFITESVGLSPFGDEDGHGEPKPGQPFKVFRIGSKNNTDLSNRNAGNAEAVCDLYNRWLDEETPPIGDTLHVFQVVTQMPFARYVRFNGEVESPLHRATGERVEGAVGRFKDTDAEIIYSFPKGGSWTAKHLKSMPLDIKQGVTLKDQAKDLRSKS